MGFPDDPDARETFVMTDTDRWWLYRWGIMLILRGYIIVNGDDDFPCNIPIIGDRSCEMRYWIFSTLTSKGDWQISLNRLMQHLEVKNYCLTIGLWSVWVFLDSWVVSGLCMDFKAFTSLGRWRIASLILISRWAYLFHKQESAWGTIGNTDFRSSD